MPRLLLEHGGNLRHLASIEATHDGSISLALVRQGDNDFGWEAGGSSEGCTPFQKVDFEAPRARTKRITIHTSGRVNYHYQTGAGRTVFTPCLLDITQQVPIVAYVVPKVESLNLVAELRTTDHVVNLSSEVTGHQTFEFSVLPAKLAGLPGEISRSIIEGCYGLACVMISGDVRTLEHGAPLEAFTTLHLTKGLPSQTVAEDVVYLRFKRLMHANAVRDAVLKLPNDSRPKDDVIEAVVERGPGLLAPNSDGVWTMICAVPMRIKPELVVTFADHRYKAELVDFAPTDRRLEKVRVRFKVYDQQEKKWVKHALEIISVELHAEL